MTVYSIQQLTIPWQSDTVLLCRQPHLQYRVTGSFRFDLILQLLLFFLERALRQVQASRSLSCFPSNKRSRNDEEQSACCVNSCRPPTVGGYSLIWEEALEDNAAFTNATTKSTHIKTSSTVELAGPRRNSMVLYRLMERKFHPKYLDSLGFIVQWSMLCLRDRVYRQSWIVNPISSRKLVRTALLGHRSLEYWLEVDDCLGRYVNSSWVTAYNVGSMQGAP